MNANNEKRIPITAWISIIVYIGAFIWFASRINYEVTAVKEMAALTHNITLPQLMAKIEETYITRSEFIARLEMFNKRLDQTDRLLEKIIDALASRQP